MRSSRPSHFRGMRLRKHGFRRPSPRIRALLRKVRCKLFPKRIRVFSDRCGSMKKPFAPEVSCSLFAFQHCLKFQGCGRFAPRPQHSRAWGANLYQVFLSYKSDCCSVSDDLGCTLHDSRSGIANIDNSVRTH